MTTLTVPDSPKMIRETLCVAQTHVGLQVGEGDRRDEHSARLERLIAQCDRPANDDEKGML